MCEICDVFETFRRKDGVYDLFQNNNWFMSRGCIDDILKHISEESKFGPVIFIFEDKSLEE